MLSLPEGGCQLHLAPSRQGRASHQTASQPGLRHSPSPPVASVAESQGQRASGGAVGKGKLSRETALPSLCLLPIFTFLANPRLLFSHHPNDNSQSVCPTRLSVFQDATLPTQAQPSLSSHQFLSSPIRSKSLLSQPTLSRVHPLGLHPSPGSAPGQTTTTPTWKPKATSYSLHVQSLLFLICSPHSSQGNLFKMPVRSCQIVQNFQLASISLGIKTKTHKMNPKALQGLALASSSLFPLLPALCSPGNPSSPIDRPGTLSPQGLCTCGVSCPPTTTPRLVNFRPQQLWPL